MTAYTPNYYYSSASYAQPAAKHLRNFEAEPADFFILARHHLEAALDALAKAQAAEVESQNHYLQYYWNHTRAAYGLVLAIHGLDQDGNRLKTVTSKEGAPNPPDPESRARDSRPGV